MAEFNPDQYLAKKTQFNPDEYLAKKAPAPGATGAPQEEPPAEEQSGWKSALHGAIQALDYPGGIARTSLAGLANIPYGAYTGKSITQPEDVVNAFKGQAPTSAQYMERAGVPAGDVENYPLIGDVSTRDLGGLAVDIATDPLTALSRAGKYGANIVDIGAEATGKKMFKSGVKKIDQVVAEKGAKPFSDVLIENKISGTTNNIRQESEQLLNKTKAERDILHAAADSAGAVVDPNIAFKEALEKAIKLGETDPGYKKLAEQLQKKIGSYMEYGAVPLSQASEWKTNLYNSMPKSAYDSFGTIKGPAAKIEKSMANGLRSEIELAGDASVPGLGQEIASKNETMQTLLTARKPLKAAAKSAKNINAITSIDVMLGGAGLAASHNPTTAALLLAAKKAGDVSKTTGFRTVGGEALMNASKPGVLTPIVNRGLIQSPWLNMKDNKNGR